MPQNFPSPSEPASQPPGLREAHAHVAWHGRALGMLNFAACRSLAECLESVRIAAVRMRAERSTDWLMALQMRVEAWDEPRWPTRQDLDKASPDRPCWVLSFDHHSLTANSAALAAAGLSDTSPDPDGGVLVRDVSGRLTGVCLEAAAGMVRAAAPEPSREELKTHVRAALVDLLHHGFVEVHDLLAQPWLPGVLAELHDEGSMPMRVGLYAPMDGVAVMARKWGSWERPGLTLLGGKVFVDGTLNARTAWMLSPYADGMSGHACGTPLMTRESIASAIVECRRLGLGLAAHAIGDGAVRACLDASELAGAWSHAPPVRIEHAEVVAESDVTRFASLGVTASVQPCHLLSDIEVLERALPDRLGRVLPLRDMIDSGLVPGRSLLFGSDTPIVRPDPVDSIQAAVGRGRADAPGRIAREQAITLAEALAAFR